MISRCIDHYKRALELYPENDLAWNNLGTVYFSLLNNNDQALTCIREANKINPHNKDYLFSLALIYNNGKNFEMALYYLDEYLKLDSTDVRVMANKAQVEAAIAAADHKPFVAVEHGWYY